MSKKNLAAIALLSITLALIMMMAPTCLAQAPPTKVTIQLQCYNGTNVIPLANETVTIKIVNATDPTNFKLFTGKTNGTGHITITDIPIAGTQEVNVTVWWNATWGVSYLVNYTSNIVLSDLNNTPLTCSIYNVRLRPVDSAGEGLPYAIVKILDVNASKMMYDVSADSTGLTKELKIPAPISIETSQPLENYYIRFTVYWTPTTPVSMIKVFNVTQSAYDWADYIDANYIVDIECSVYYVTVIYIYDQNDIPVTSQGDLFLLACIYANGTLMSTQARIEEGMTIMRVATIAIDDSPGQGQLDDYEFRIYWEWSAPSIRYLVYVDKKPFGTIDGDNIYDLSSVGKTNTVYGSIRLLDKSGSPLSLANVEISFPLYNYVFTTDTIPMTGLDGCVDWSPIIGAWWNYYPYCYDDVMLLPTKHNNTELTFSIKATFEGVKVLETTFKPVEYDNWDTHPWYGPWYGIQIPMLELTCNVYWVSFNLLDAHDRLLSGIASLKVTYPDYGVTISFLVHNGAGGRRMPGGSGLTAAIDYKDVEGLPLLEPAGFNINDTSTSIALKFPVYNLVVYVYDWYGEVKLDKLNCTITFTKGLWNGITQIASYNDTLKSHTFEQMPAGGTYAINVSTRMDGTTPGLNASGAIGKLLARVTVTMPASDYVTDVRVPLYNPTFVIKAADGSDIPAYLANLTYIVVQANTSTIGPIFVNNTVQITYKSNQTLGVCFVGSWVYPLRVYIAGVLVYGEAVKLPADTDVVELRVNLYGSTIRVLTYDGSYPIPSMNVRFGWTGLNVTSFDASALLTNTWSDYFDNFKGVSTNAPAVIAYNASAAVTNADGVAKLWVPVWNVSGLNYTTIVYGVYTIPGVTGGVPSTAPVVQVAPYDGTWISIMGKLVNITAAKDVGDVRVYACNFYVRVLDYLDRPLANYVVFVNGSYAAGAFRDVIATQRTNSTGGALFISGAEGVFFFANYTYTVNAFEDVALPYPQIASGSLCANWTHGCVVTVRFGGALIIKALDWSGSPLKNATVKLFWASGPWAGGLTAVAKTNAEGVSTIIMADTNAYYTVEVWFKGSLVNQRYRLEEQLKFPEGVSVFSYTERMLVFNPKMTFVSDVGGALPAGIEVEVMLPDGSVVKSKTDATGSIVLSQVPIGKHVVKATWEGVKIYDSELWISSDAPLTLKTTVYEVTISVLTRKGTPLAGATVEFVYPNGKAETVTLDSEGKSPKLLVAASAAINELRIKSVTWAGVPISLETIKTTITASGPVTFRATNVYTLKVSVVGAVGQLLDGASLVVLKDGKVVASTIAKGGVAEIELPEGTYKVQASYLGKTGETSASLTQDVDAKVTLDVFIVIGNQAFSMGEVILWIVIAIIIIIVLALIIIALTRIRRKPAAPPTKEATA
ncbi:MAG: carboxypeptidase-like regulatory domain-containing protein [Candidatus Nezhaarchaeales archaeon]